MIELDEVRHSYGSREALTGVSACLSSARVALLGPNGAGKSTLISLLTTSVALQSGTIRIDGLDLTDRSSREQARAHLGYVPQHLGLPASYTCAEFLAWAGWMHRVGDVDAAGTRALAAVGLQDRAGDRIGSLSGGMRQRLCIAQALVHQPSVLVVDEPSVGLDPQQRARLRTTLAGLDCQLVLATHLVDDVAGLADEVLVLDQGRVGFHGTTTELCAGEAPTAAAVEAGYLRLVEEQDA